VSPIELSDIVGDSVRFPTGQGKLAEVREFVWSGKSQGKILFFKSQGK